MSVNDSVVTLEELEYQDFVENELTVTVFLIILCVVGTLGNTHAIFVYMLRYKPSNHKIFVVWLSFVDLIACTFSIPFELFDIRYSNTFTSVEACKFFRFLSHFVSVCSGTLLGVIAVERFRKACRPFGRQVTEKEAKLACLITVVLSVLLSVPSLVMYGVAIEPVDGHPLNSTDCTVVDSYRGTLSFRLYNYFLLFLSTAVFIICTVMYVFIGKVLYRQLKFRQTAQVQSRRHDDSKGSGEVRPSNQSSGNALPLRERQSNASEHSSASGEMTYKYVKYSCSPFRGRLDRSKQITLMFLVATAVSYIGYLPYIFLTVFKALNKNAYSSLASNLGSFNDVLLRGYFINNVVNPIVYCFLDDRYRYEFQELYKSIGKFMCTLCCRERKDPAVTGDSIDRKTVRSTT